jgi:hypothetical protein
MMKKSNQVGRPHTGSGWRAATLASLVLCAALVVPSRGSVGGGNGETVGTLPSTSGGVSLEISRIANDAAPAMFVEGSMQAIYDAVVGLSGRSIVTAEALDTESHTVRVTFHGDFRLELDRQAFEQGALKIGWTVPQAFGPAQVRLSLGERVLASGIVDGRSLVLPVQALESTGGLDAAPLDITTRGRHGHAVFEAFASGDRLILSQSH